MLGLGRLTLAVLSYRAAFDFHSTVLRRRSHRRLPYQFAKTSVGVAYQADISLLPQEAQSDGNASFHGPLSMNIQESAIELDGSGRAAVVWDCLRAGIDPNLYYNSQGGGDDSDDAIADAWARATACTVIPGHDVVSSGGHNMNNIFGRREGQGLGPDAWKRLQKLMRGYHRFNNSSIGQSGNTDEERQSHGDENVYTIENSIASLSHMNVSPDGTTKLLLKMKKDGLEVESVIIPWFDKGFSTLCVS
jgi:hypothetical protein